MSDTNKIDCNDPRANMFGILPCPKCEDTHRWPTQRDTNDPPDSIMCGECGFVEKADKSGDAMRVTTQDGKYTVVQKADGRLFAERHGRRWRDLTGDKLVLTLAQDVQALRRFIEAQGPEMVETLKSAEAERLYGW